MKHIPVLLDRVLETLGDINGKTIVDCTFGAGGYSRAFLERGANVIAFDRDPNVVPDADKLKSEFGDKFTFINTPFSEIINHKSEIINHIVFDFGISSMQIDQADRGFSFRFDGPLDMRMDHGSNCERSGFPSIAGVREAGGGLPKPKNNVNHPALRAPLQWRGTRPSQDQTALGLIENSSSEQLAKILREYGDLKKANILANAIKKALPKTTFELRDLIHNPKDVAPVFQALRIAVNDELGEIERALDAVPDLLPTGGMCVCVTFHSIEDRIVKNKFREWTASIGDPRLPTIETPSFDLLKTYRPSEQELENNPRARSAHMRAVIKSC